MIKAKELRMGNLVQVGDDEPIAIEVFNILDTGINQKLVYDEDFPEADPTIDLWLFEYIYPIPITAEWLLKAGFIEDDDWYGIKTDSGELFYYPAGQLLDFVDLNNSEVRLSESILHVHQLQNVYFSLSGKDLRISLEKVL